MRASHLRWRKMKGYEVTGTTDVACGALVVGRSDRR